MKAMKAMVISLVHRRATGYLTAVLGSTVVTASSAPFRGQLEETIVALALLLVVLFVTTFWGRGPGMVAALLSVGGYTFFLWPAVPPLDGLSRFTRAHSQHGLALASLEAYSAGAQLVESLRGAYHGSQARRP